MKLAFLTAISTAALLSFIPSQAQAASLYVSTSDGEVGSIDETTGAYTSLLDGAPSFADIALDPDNQLWGVGSGRLFSIDLGTETTSEIGVLGASINGLGFSDDGTLYGSGTGGFYSVDTSTGTASLINAIADFSSSGDIVYDADLDLFWATSRGDSLWSITKEGEATKVGDIGFSNVYGLAFGDNNTLYGYTANRQQIELDLETGAGTFVQSLSNLSSAVWGSASDPSDGSSDPTAKTPEPSALIGLGTLGLLAFRKRR